MMMRQVLMAGAVLVAVALPARTEERKTVAAPSRVFVVNTQDASVSLVDLASMKEIKRYKVGPRPYGIAVQKGDTEFINWVNTQLKRMARDGSFERIWKKHLGEFEAHLVKP